MQSPAPEDEEGILGTIDSLCSSNSPEIVEKLAYVIERHSLNRQLYAIEKLGEIEQEAEKALKYLRGLAKYYPSQSAGVEREHVERGPEPTGWKKIAAFLFPSAEEEQGDILGYYILRKIFFPNARGELRTSLGVNATPRYSLDDADEFMAAQRDYTSWQEPMLKRNHAYHTIQQSITQLEGRLAQR
jgi:hypothetical protein|tara:strand:- start:141 stop:701 length:561 start_codon:yes stop_codon:yes gene_type:complete